MVKEIDPIKALVILVGLVFSATPYIISSLKETASAYEKLGIIDKQYVNLSYRVLNITQFLDTFTSLIIAITVIIGVFYWFIKRLE